MTSLPYRATTATGETFDFSFPLHPNTVDPVRVQQLIGEILESIDRSITVSGETGNGDVLQAAAIALAIRAKMIHAPEDTTAGLSLDLLRTALTAAADAHHESRPHGTA